MAHDSSDKPRFLAHSANRAGEEHPLAEHLKAVGELAARFAETFGAAEEARAAGLLHDLGKYGDLFQRRLRGEERGIDHWSAGAWEAVEKYKSVVAALAAEGHHIGLRQAAKDHLFELNPARTIPHPLGLRFSETDSRVLLDRLLGDGVNVVAPRSLTKIIGAKQAVSAMLDVRMLFSALVDADFLDTEAHFECASDGAKRCRPQGLMLDHKNALAALMEHKAVVASETAASEEVKRLRDDLFDSCLDRGADPQGLYTLTAPTGAGKTLAMLAFALRHAERHGLRRVVTVIPYLSIIDQTVKVYRQVFPPGRFGVEFVLEDHSMTGGGKRNEACGSSDLDAESEARRRERELAENWDAPIIVTTSVQMLESLFANRPAPCRKLHRLARSVILFDEIQTLPVHLAVPTLAALARLSERYGTTVVFSTATQPAFSHLDKAVGKLGPGWKAAEIVPADLNLFSRAKRTRARWPNLDEPTPWDDLARKLSTHRQALCIVNVKRHARRLVELLQEQHKTEGVYHLSTSMCPAHRKAVLEEVRGRLLRSEPCLLVSTQCVEAGVDLDFPIVYRALGPLESIAQAAGRCNRNGRLPTGDVVVFVPEEEVYPPGAYGQAAGVTRMLLMERDGSVNLDDPDVFVNYYRKLYDLTRPETHRKELSEAIMRLDFAQVARMYRLIDQDTVNVLVPYDTEVFKCLANEVRMNGLTSGWVRKARPHAVGVFRPGRDHPAWSYLEPAPVVRGRPSEDWFICLGETLYEKKVVGGTGLTLPETQGFLSA